jgi:transcriptional regulator of acetoin/glycerol metabolism
MVQAETFRRDLYFRINTFPIHIPALHERAEDIPLLAISLLERVDRKTHRAIFSEGALDLALRPALQRQYPRTPQPDRARHAARRRRYGRPRKT